MCQREKNEHLPQHRWEEVTDQIFENANMALAKIDAWKTRDPEYDFVFLHIVARYLTIRHQINLVADMLPDHSNVKNDVFWAKKEIASFLENAVKNDPERVGRVISEKWLESLKTNFFEFFELMSYCRKTLQVTEWEEWIEEEKKDSAYNFLISFQALSLARHALEEPLLSQFSSSEFKGLFSLLDFQFRRIFGLMDFFSEELERWKNQFFLPPLWWLQFRAHDEIPQETENSRDDFELAECPLYEKVLAFETGKVSAKNMAAWEILELRSHVRSCLFCSLGIFDRQLAELKTE